jgi:hypothetical protein
MINADALRKTPEPPSKDCYYEGFSSILDEIKSMILAIKPSRNAVGFNISTNTIHDGNHTFIVSDEQHRKVLTRLICIEMLSRNFDVVYVEHALRNTQINTKVMIEW